MEFKDNGNSWSNAVSLLRIVREQALELNHDMILLTEGKKYEMENHLGYSLFTFWGTHPNEALVILWTKKSDQLSAPKCQKRFLFVGVGLPQKI